MLKAFYALVVLSTLVQVVHAQVYFNEPTNLTEIWVRAQANYSLRNQWKASTNTDYRNISSDSETLTVNTLTQDFVYLLNPSIELVGSLRLFHTVTEASTTNELRPAIGMRIDLLRSGRFTIRNYFRYESRHFFFEDESLNGREGRFRNRLFGSVALNKKTDFSKNTLLLRWGLELFSGKDAVDDQIFLNRYRAEAGFGYNLNDHWRFNLVYFRQDSRSKPKGDFYVRGNIFFLTCTYTILSRKGREEK